MPVYPNPNWTGFEDLFNHSNLLTGSCSGGVCTNYYMFGLSILVMVFIIIFLILMGRQKEAEPEKAFAAGMFVTTVTSYLLLAVGLIYGEIVIITTILTIVSVLLIYRS